MLVNQAVCRIQPEPTLLRDPSNRRIALDWNIQKSIERQFAQARKAWVRYQSTRQRDAVFGYLSAVFQVVQRWAMLGHTRTCSRHALTATKHRCAIRTRDPFAIVIFCTSDPQVVDARTRSKLRIGRRLDFCHQLLLSHRLSYLRQKQTILKSYPGSSLPVEGP